MSAHIGSILRQRATDDPENVVLIDRTGPHRRCITAGELQGAAGRVTAALRARGVRPGDRVALWLDQGWRGFAAWFGVVNAGAAVVPLAITMPEPARLERALRLRCRALVVDRPEDCPPMDGAIPVNVTLDELWGGPAPGSQWPGESGGFLHPPNQGPALILATSGTTGRSKGAAIGHDALLSHTRALVAETLRLGCDDIVLGVLPMTHSYGLRMVGLVSLLAGATAVILDRFDAQNTIEIAREEGATWLPMVPTMVAAMANLPPGPSLPKLKWCLSAGAPISDAHRVAAAARLGAPIRQGYGMTEASFCTIDAPPKPAAPGTVGRPVSGVQLRVVRPDGRACALAETGEIQVRGINRMQGYIDEPGATADAMDGKWLRTGDLGHLDAEGRLTVDGRLKDLILRGGVNIVPSAVEAVLAQHPKVRQVAVVGRPDGYYGEEVVAVIVADPSGAPEAAELLEWQRARIDRARMARVFALVDVLPLGPSNKVLKRKLRAGLAAGEIPILIEGICDMSKTTP